MRYIYNVGHVHTIFKPVIMLYVCDLCVSCTHLKVCAGDLPLVAGTGGPFGLALLGPEAWPLGLHAVL